MDKIIPQLKAVAQALGVPEAGEQVATRVQKDLDYALQVLRTSPWEGAAGVVRVPVRARYCWRMFFVLGKVRALTI